MAAKKGNPADETIRRAADSAHSAVDKVADVTSDTADTLTQKGQQIKHKEEQWLENVNQYVQKNPCTSIGIAVAGGFLLSRILSNR